MGIWCVQFSGQIRVCFLKTRIFINLIRLCLDMGHHHETNANYAERT